MKTTTTIHLRRFPLTVKDERTGEVFRDTVTLDKGTLQAAQIVGESSKEVIYRLYNRKGFKVLEIGPAYRLSVPVDLEELFQASEVTVE